MSFIYSSLKSVRDLTAHACLEWRFAKSRNRHGTFRPRLEALEIRALPAFPASHLVIVSSPPLTMTAGQSVPLSVEAEDLFGDPGVDSRDLILTLSISYTGMSPGTPVSSAPLSAGSSGPVDFGLTAPQPGTLTVTVSNDPADLQPAILTITVTSPVLHWTGDDGTAWSDPKNWQEDTKPAAGNTLIFPAGAQNLTNVNDLPDGTQLNTIDFTGPGYNVSGTPSIQLTGSLQDEGGDTTYNIPTTLAGNVNASVTTGTLTVSSVLSGSGNLSIDNLGDGELDLTGANDKYSGTITLKEGVLGISSSGALGSNSLVVNQSGNPAVLLALGGSPGSPLPLANGVTLAMGSLTLEGALSFGQVIAIPSGTEIDIADPPSQDNSLHSEVTFQKGMTGAGALKVESGTFIVPSNSANYSGLVTLQGGTIKVGVSGTPLGTGVLQLGTGTADENAALLQNIANAVVVLPNYIKLQADATLSIGPGLNLCDPLDLPNPPPSALEVAVNATLTVTGGQAGTQGLEFIGPINADTLGGGSPATLSLTANSNSKVSLIGEIDGPVDVSGGSTRVFVTGAINSTVKADTGAEVHLGDPTNNFTPNGTGTVVAGSGGSVFGDTNNKTFGGTIILDGGAIGVSTDNGLGTGLLQVGDDQGQVSNAGKLIAASNSGLTLPNALKIEADASFNIGSGLTFSNTQKGSNSQPGVEVAGTSVLTVTQAIQSSQLVFAGKVTSDPTLLGQSAHLQLNGDEGIQIILDGEVAGQVDSIGTTDLILDGTLDRASTVNAGGTNSTLAVVELGNSQNNLPLAGAGTLIASAGGFVKGLQNNPDFTGTVILAGGTIKVGVSGTPLGTGVLLVGTGTAGENAGLLQNIAGAIVVLPNYVKLQADATLSIGPGLNLCDPLDLPNPPPSALEVAVNATLTVTGGQAGTQGLEFIGPINADTLGGGSPATLSLTANSNSKVSLIGEIDGPVDVSGGSTRVFVTGAINSTVKADTGAEMHLGDPTNNFTPNGTGTVVAGSGGSVFGDANNRTFGGTIILDGGTIGVSTDNGLGTGLLQVGDDQDQVANAGELIAASGGVLNLANAVKIESDATFNIGSSEVFFTDANKDAAHQPGVEVTTDSTLTVTGAPKALLAFFGKVTSDAPADDLLPAQLTVAGNADLSVSLSGEIAADVVASGTTDLVLDGMLDQSSTVEVSGNGTTPAIVELGSFGLSLTGSGMVIASPNGVVKGVVNNPNFTGTVFLDGGTVKVAAVAAAPLGTGTLQLGNGQAGENAGLLQNSANDTVALPNSIKVQADATLSIGPGLNLCDPLGLQNVQVASALEVGANATLTVTGGQAGTQGLEIIGPINSDTLASGSGSSQATLSLTGSSSSKISLIGEIDGPVDVSGGNTQVFVTGAINNTIEADSGAELHLGDATNNDAPNGLGTVVAASGGTVFGDVNNKTFGGKVILDGGTIGVNSDNGLGTGLLQLGDDQGQVSNAGKLIAASNGGLTLGNSLKIEADATFNIGSGLTFSNTQAGVEVAAASTLTVTQAIQSSQLIFAGKVTSDPTLLGQSFPLQLNGDEGVQIILDGEVAGQVDAAGSTDLLLDGTLDGNSTIQSGGTTGSNALVEMGDATAGKAVRGTCTILVQSGNILRAAIANPNLSGTIILSGGTIQLKADHGLGTATIQQQGSQSTITGDPILDNPLNVQTGSLVLEGGQLIFTQPITVQGTSSVTIDPTGVVTVQNLSLSNNALVTVEGKLIAPAGSTVNLTDNSQLLLHGGTTEAHGTINAASGAVLQLSPDHLAITAPSPVVAGSQVPITVELLDAKGNPAQASNSGVTINLTSSSASGIFLDANGHVLATPSITIPAFATTGAFEYEDTKQGTPTLTVGANGLTSASQLESISPIALTLTASANPAQVGKTMTLSASLRSVVKGVNIGTGTVTFFDGTTVLGTVAIKNAKTTATATFKTSKLSLGSHAISVSYQTATTIAPPSAILTEVVQNTTTSVSVSPAAPVFGQKITFTATVKAVIAANGTPAGTVTFTDGTTVLGTGMLTAAGKGIARATFNTTPLPAGKSTITASYASNGVFTSCAAVTTVTVKPAATKLSLHASPNPLVHGQTLTLTAPISVTSPGAGTPAGTVKFMDGNTVLGTGALQEVNGVNQAVLTTTLAAAGKHKLKAVFAGTTSFAGSASAVLTETVQ